MRGAARLRIGFGLLLVLGSAMWAVGGIVSCGTAPTPFIVQGPGHFGNDPPTLTFLEPTGNITRGQGDPILLRWTDTDRDNNAQISFSLVSTTSTESILLVTGIDENDTTGPDTFTISTTLIAPDTYNILATISDEVNPPVEVYAVLSQAAVSQRVVVTIVGPGEGPQTEPPRIVVTEPTFNLSVAQDDILTIIVQPSESAPDPINPVPYDSDSNVRLFIVADLDLNPNNDDPANPDPSQIIVLREQTVQAGAFEVITFDIPIDLAVTPPRPAGEPYYIRATVDDGTNPRVHQYAIGKISVVQLAAGKIDLFDIGRTKSGAKFQGFNPGANLGSEITYIPDFDVDGIEDFVIVAQFGNPQNVGPVGEAYLIYGRDEIRFGGTIPVNSVGDTVSGVIFQAPPVRTGFYPDPTARTDGIVDVDYLPDLTGDGRPELIFGLPHVHWAYDSTDYDPADENPTDISPWGCYPDLIVNNLTDQDDDRLDDTGWYAGGMAVVINSQNRDNNGLINLDRLESTAVALELAGQFPAVLDAGGLSGTGNIIGRADNDNTENLGDDPQEGGRISGSRIIAGGFDWLDAFFLNQPPREGLFGQKVSSLGDLNSDGLAEVIISAPRNERYLADLESESITSTHLWSTLYRGSILVLPGFNYNIQNWREMNDDNGTSVSPYLDHHTFPPYGNCTGAQSGPRQYVIPAEAFAIFAEDIDDMLGGGQSAGDFNQDGLDDILCAAPLNDRSSSLADTGTVYVIYGRTIFGEVRLSSADDPVMRPPMLRIRGLSLGDQIGWRATAGLDVNGDRIDDVFIGSPRTDWGGVTRSTCAGDFNGDGAITQGDLSVRSFNTCEAQYGDDVFSDDGCKVFDYDNDGHVDDDDRCVFCCLSDDCDPEDSCVFGRDDDCCESLVDNGFVGIVFGGVFIDGDRDITQLATSQLPGVIFFGGSAGDRSGFDISSAGDFNQDGFGDILIAAPGRTEQDSAGRERLGVVYLIFGGTHLTNTTWNLEEVGSENLPGIVFLSPYTEGRPNEAAPMTVGFIGDINNDGFGDIAIGNPKADFIDPSYPQGPDAPGSDPATGRRSDVGDVYVIYGNNFGSNRALP